MLLPTSSGTIEDYQMLASPLCPRAPTVALSRTAFAAAHVVVDARAQRNPWLGRAAIDWDSTLRFRHWLWDQGFGIAEAMDTAQRGMGLDWPQAKELIERSLTEASTHPLNPRVACGAGTDQITDLKRISEAAIIAAYLEQMEAIETAGGQVIIMASRALAALGGDAATYARVYEKLIEQAQEPVILHWLGDMFDPALAGYWGETDLDRAADSVLSLIDAHANRIDGIKISLLDRQREESLRARLPNGVRLYTGDDFNYVPLLAGDGKHYSHALLGIFAAIAPAASQGLEALATGDLDTYHDLLLPTVPLAREIFTAPTQFYKAGIAFLSWLNGTQQGFIMPAGLQSSRDISHYANLFRLADQARLLQDPELAQSRMSLLLRVHGLC